MALRPKTDRATCWSRECGAQDLADDANFSPHRSARLFRLGARKHSPWAYHGTSGFAMKVRIASGDLGAKHTRPAMGRPSDESTNRLVGGLSLLGFVDPDHFVVFRGFQHFAALTDELALAGFLGFFFGGNLGGGGFFLGSLGCLFFG